jgi:predicted metal-dependent enzyme (double-stranded beta helix superfamily)
MSSLALRSPLSLADLTGLVRLTAADESAWRPKLQLPTSTDRWWTRLLNDPDVDVWLLSWLPGHATDLHDHGSSLAAFTVVEGQLDEVRIEPDGTPTRHRRPQGSLTWLSPGVVHDVTGAGASPAVSIHAYSPPLTRMNYLERGAGGAVRLTRTVETCEPEEELTR